MDPSGQHICAIITSSSLGHMGASTLPHTLSTSFCIWLTGLLSLGARTLRGQGTPVYPGAPCLAWHKDVQENLLTVKKINKHGKISKHHMPNPVLTSLQLRNKLSWRSSSVCKACWKSLLSTHSSSWHGVCTSCHMSHWGWSHTLWANIVKDSWGMRTANDTLSG